jgi:hypothetical protein
MAIVRTLNDSGKAVFRAFLAAVRTDPATPAPYEILQNEASSEALRWTIDVEPRSFASRLEAARYLNERFQAAGALDLEREAGMWSWLALFYFDLLCPELRGRRSPGEEARFIPDSRRYFRHLLAAPWSIYKAYAADPGQAMIVLCQPLHRPGRYCDHLAARRELLTSPAVIGAATRLYYDATTGKPKRRGHSSRPGNFARFIAVVSQLDVTFDLYSLTADALLWRLPREEFGQSWGDESRAATTAQTLPLELL